MKAATVAMMPQVAIRNGTVLQPPRRNTLLFLMLPQAQCPANIQALHLCCLHMYPFHHSSSAPQSKPPYAKYIHCAQSMAKDSQQDSIRRQIADITGTLSSLKFDHFFHESNEGPVYVVREVPSQSPHDDRLTRLYELGPDEISQIIEDNIDLPGPFVDLPTHTQLHRHTGDYPIS